MRICHQRATYSGSRNAGAPTVLPILLYSQALRSKSEGFCEVLEVPTIMFEDEGKELQV